MQATATTHHLQAILRAFDPGLTLVRSARPGHGIANDVWMIETSGDPLVLKTYDASTGAWKPQREAAIYAVMRDLGIPAPTVHIVDASCDVVPFAWSLAERLDGDVYSSVFDSLGEDDHIRIYGQLGGYLGALHGTKFAHFGGPVRAGEELTAGPVPELDFRGPFVQWAEMHDAIVAARLRLMERTAFADLVPGVETYLHDHRFLIEGEIVPRLLHMDLHQGNILVSSGQVTGILDVEEAIIGHNEYDLMRTELAHFRGSPPAFERAFRCAYEEHVPIDEGYPRRRHFYDVSRTLAWIQSILLHGTGEHQRAARSHLRSLLQGGA